METKTKKAQEEMVGFALIIVIVAIIFLVFLAFTLNKPEKENLNSYEVKGFLDATLTCTTDCKDERNSEFLPIMKLINDCSQELSCQDRRNTCEVLEKDLKEIAEKSWDLTRYKGYEIKILMSNQNVIDPIREGNITKRNKGYLEEIDGESLVFMFKAYY